MAITRRCGSSAVLMLGVLACDGSKRSSGISPTPKVKTADKAADSPAQEQEIWRCTSEDIGQLRGVIETSCSIRPKYRDDCLALYEPLPLWSFDASRSHTRDYCSLERPDSKTIIMTSSGPGLGKSCVTYSAKFERIEQEWKLASMDIDKSCSE